MIVCKNPGSLWFWSHADLWKHKNCEKKHDSKEVLSSFIKNNLYKRVSKTTSKSKISWESLRSIVECSFILELWYQ